MHNKTRLKGSIIEVYTLPRNMLIFVQCIFYGIETRLIEKTEIVIGAFGNRKQDL